MSESDQKLVTDRRAGRTAVMGWALGAVLLVAVLGTAMSAPIALAQPVTVADATDATSAPVALDPLALLPTARPMGPTAVLPNLPTIAAAPPATVTATTPTASVPGAQLRQTAFTTDAPDNRAALAIRTALAQIGLPYVWGGNGPTNGDKGFDCSGLTTFSYKSAGVPLPRTAHTQYNAGPHVPDGAPLQPGDLVFYGTTARVHHVGMYLGAGRMVNAPTFGKPVQVAFYRYRGDDYLGATRPAASPGSLTNGILPYVDPALLPTVQPTVPQIFTAPTAPMVALPQPGDVNLPPEQVSAAQAIQEGDTAAARTAAARSTAVAGTTTSTTAPVSTAPATNAPATVSTVTSPTAPATTAAPGTTTVPAAPATTTTPSTTPSTTAAPAAPATTSTTPKPKPKPKPASTTTKATTPPKTAGSTAAPAGTTTSEPPDDDTTTAKATKATAEDDATSKEKATAEATKESEETKEPKEEPKDSDDGGSSDDTGSADSGGDD